VSRDFLDACYGALIGGAIGDAMGAPVENWHYTDVRRRHGKVDAFLPQPARQRDGQPGQITDDTTLRHYLCLAIAEKPGRITPEDYARVWLERLNPDRLFATERIVLEKLKLGMSPWDTGRGQPLADAAIMSIAPVGIVNAGDPAQAYQDAFALAGIHQDGIERDAAATVAAGTATAVLPAATLAEVIATMRAHSTFDVRRLIELAIETADASADVDAFAERFHARLLDHSFPLPPGEAWSSERSVSPTSREVLPAVVGILLLCDPDPNRCIVEAASIGRDADTIATVTGTLAGALHGAHAIRSDWSAASETANAAFFAELEGDPAAGFHRMAERMVDAVEAERRRAQQRHATLASLLGAGEC
jgi:ADP-ribosylglycohydrolase